MQAATQCYGVILSGGKGSRMGYKDKALLPLADRPLLEWVIKNAEAQVESLVLSVNRNPEKYRYLQRDIIADYNTAVAGPLVGIVSAMRTLSAEQRSPPPTALLACFAADVPWFPEDLVKRLGQRLQQTNADVVIAEHRGFLQPLFSLWKLSLLPQLEAAVEQGFYGPKQILPKLNYAVEEFAAEDEQSFFNINTPDDLEYAQNLYKKSQKQ